VPGLTASVKSRSDEATASASRRSVGRGRKYGGNDGMTIPFQNAHTGQMQPNARIQWREKCALLPVGAREARHKAGGLRVPRSICWAVRYGATVEAMKTSSRLVNNWPNVFRCS
jgi:hypothetical protein